jgi:hypothetical protein
VRDVQVAVDGTHADLFIRKPNSITFPRRAGETHFTFFWKLFGM